MPRAEFRKTVEGAVRNSFLHSLLAKGRLLYTHDETIAGLCARLHEIGERDTQVQLLAAATQALPPIDKAHKWFVTRGDLDYTALWILYAATPLARIEVLGARLLADREVIPQAMKLNPAFFKTIYTDHAQREEDAEERAGGAGRDRRLSGERAATLFAAGARSSARGGRSAVGTEIEAHFKRNFDMEGVTTACEYLADQGLIGKASTPVQLTKKSNVMVQELAFVLHGGRPDGSRRLGQMRPGRRRAPPSRCRARACTTSRTSRWRSRATG